MVELSPKITFNSLPLGHPAVHAALLRPFCDLRVVLSNDCVSSQNLKKVVKTCGRPSISRISTIIQTLRLAGVEEAPVIGLGGDQLPEEEEEGDGGEEGEQGGLQQVHAHVVVDKNQPVIVNIIIVREGQRWFTLMLLWAITIFWFGHGRMVDVDAHIVVLQKPTNYYCYCWH